MVYNGKTLSKWMISGYHYFRKHPYLLGGELQVQLSIQTSKALSRSSNRGGQDPSLGARTVALAALLPPGHTGAFFENQQLSSW